MKLLLACLLLGLSLPAVAQTRKPAQAQDSVLERAKKRCEENRGTDCKSREGLKPWIVEETPMTKQQQQSGAAARHRRECAASKNKLGC